MYDEHLARLIPHLSGDPRADALAEHLESVRRESGEPAACDEVINILGGALKTLINARRYEAARSLLDDGVDCVDTLEMASDAAKAEAPSRERLN